MVRGGAVTTTTVHCSTINIKSMPFLNKIVYKLENRSKCRFFYRNERCSSPNTLAGIFKNFHIVRGNDLMSSIQDGGKTEGLRYPDITRLVATKLTCSVNLISYFCCCFVDGL